MKPEHVPTATFVDEQAARAALHHGDEWKLVPVKPTLEMAEKGAEAFSLPHPQSVGAENERAALIYRLMLGTAPSQVDSRDALETERARLWRENRELRASLDVEKAVADCALREKEGLVKALEEIAASRRMNCHEMSDEERAEYWSALALRYRSIASKALAATEKQP